MPYVDPEKTREANRRWYARHREREAEKRHQWHVDNRERDREYARAYYETHKDEILERTNHRRRATGRTEGSQDWIEILKGDPCSYCGGTMEEIDHIDSLSKGGDHTWENLTAACLTCNRSKHTKTLLEQLCH